MKKSGKWHKSSFFVIDFLFSDRLLGNEVDIYGHPSSERYPNQQISVVIVEEYVYLVPFIENDEEIFLKTVIPSRKATKKYIGDRND